MIAGNPDSPTVAPWPGPDDGDEGRQRRGLAIAANCRIDKIQMGYRVPSQSGAGHYTVVANGDDWLCSCPDFEQRGTPCKHVYAVQYHIYRENGSGIAAIDSADRPLVEPPVQPEPWNLDAPLREVSKRKTPQSNSSARGEISPATAGKSKPTYRQHWPTYNPSQKNEKAHFRHLLKDLSALAEGRVHHRGRKPYLRSDQVFSLIYKIYVGKSWRVFDTDLREAKHNHFIQQAASTSSLSRFMDDPSLTPILLDLILCSALPMKPFERHFAIDGTGFSSDHFARWVIEKWGELKELASRDWVKLHLVCGTETHIITSVEVSDRRDHDNRYFQPLVSDTATHFTMESIAADKAYTSRKNFTFVEGLGSTMFAPFKSNVVEPKFTDDSAWARMYHWFMSDYAGWVSHYHLRNIAESTISTVKRRFGGRLTSHNVVAQCNELLCQVIAHNLIVIIHAMYERGLEPQFQPLT